MTQLEMKENKRQEVKEVRRSRLMTLEIAVNGREGWRWIVCVCVGGEEDVLDR